MVTIIPSNRERKEFNGSIGEQYLYDKFNELDDDYIVFHSIQWTDKPKKKKRFGEADYLIFHKKRGILSVEVKHGGIRGSDNRIFQINRNTREEYLIRPLYQADSSKFYFLEYLMDKNINIPIHSLVWFTGVEKRSVVGELPPQYITGGNTVFYEDLGDISKTFEKLFNFNGMKPIEIDKITVNNVIKYIAPEFNAFPSLANVIETNDYYFNRMTAEQSTLLDYLEEQEIAGIQGTAGTGKTMIAIEKAKRLSAKEEVVFLCFNSLLVKFLRNRYEKELPNVTFTNLYSIVSKAYKRIVNEDDIITFLGNTEEFPNDWKYKSIIVDEGQDFSTEMINKLKDISILNDGSFYVFYDKNQLVQQRNNLEWLQIMDCNLVLSINCRNTMEIAKSSTRPLKIEDKKIKTKYKVEGNPPYFYNLNSNLELFEKISKNIRNFTEEGIQKNQIVILTVKTLERSLLNGFGKIGNYKIVNEPDGKNILFTTARKFKGMESDVVLLVDLDEETLSDDESLRVFYVGASRAKTQLNLYSQMNVKQLKNFCKKLSDGETDRPTALIKYLLVQPRN